MEEVLKAKLRQKFGKVYESRGKNGLEYTITCPFCKRKRKMGVNPTRKAYYCHACTETGSITALIGRTHYTQPIQEMPVPLPDDIASPGILMPLSQLDEDSPPLIYIRNRNYTVQELARFGTRYCSEGQKFGGGMFDTTNTLVFPIWMGKRLVGWQARLLYEPRDVSDESCAALGFIQDDDGDYVRPPKYWTSPGMPKGRVMFNYDSARLSNIVVVCEGPFDAIAVGKCAVATLGKGISPQQANLIKNYWDLAILMLDPGDADAEAAQLDANLRITVPVIRVKLQGYKDAGEAPRKEIWNQICQAAEDKDINLAEYNIIV